MRSAMQITKLRVFLVVIFVSIQILSGCAASAESPRERISINNDWRFTRNDPNEAFKDNLNYPVNRIGGMGGGRGGQGAAAESPVAAVDPAFGIAAFILPTGNDFIADPNKRYVRPAGNYGADVSYVSSSFNDAEWHKVDLPHDYAIEGPFITTGGGGMGRLPTAGAAWYRKHLTIRASDSGKQIFLEIDGSMSYTTVWCNGQIAGGWSYGYSSWQVDLTPYVRFGSENVLAIRLDNQPNSSRWYPGAGIYRNVWLTMTSPVHIGQ